MARLYADEQFPRLSTEYLRTLDHDVLTVQEAGRGNQGIPDDEVLDFATAVQRAVVTLNRRDFIQLHRRNVNHGGIVVCKDDPDKVRLAQRVDEAIAAEEPLAGKLIRVNRGA